MTISIQNTIVNSIKATLEKITVANGYQTNIASVKRGVRSIEDFEGNLPGISLWKYRNNREDSYQPGSESRLILRAWGYVECEPLQDDYDALDKLVADVEKVLMSSTHNSAYYTNTFINDTTFYEGGTGMNFGIFEMEFEISYFYDFTNI